MNPFEIAPGGAKPAGRFASGFQNGRKISFL
jgi:hypothetical protein